LQKGIGPPQPPDSVAPSPTTGALRLLLWASRFLAILRPLTPQPGWYFGCHEENPELLTKVRKLVWRAFRHLETPGDLIVPWHGGTRLWTYLGNDLSRQVFVGGDFEPNELALLDHNLAEGMVFADVGAHEGCYTIFAAAKVGPTGRVVAIEPSRREIRRLSRNLRLNECNNVTLVSAALGDRIGTGLLKVAEGEHSGHNTLGSFIYGSTREVGVERVPTTTLDRLVRDLGLERLDVVKLDVEGRESQVFRGAVETLRRFRPLVLFEAVPSDISGRERDTACEEASKLGYELYWFDRDTALPSKDATRAHGFTAVAVHPDSPRPFVVDAVGDTV